MPALPVSKPAPLVRGLTGVIQSPLTTSKRERERLKLTGEHCSQMSFSVLFARTESTLEVAMSKIFCGGAGWQAMSVVAGLLGAGPTSAIFFVLTGLGDAAGVFCGHLAFRGFSRYALRRAEVNIRAEALVALWLGSAAVFSGTAWQPVVNALNPEQPFVLLCLWTALLTGLAFFTGLRVFRSAYARFGMEEPFADNFNNDRLLSAAVGAGLGIFVATDPSFPNPLAISEHDPAILGIVKAGISTFVGFVALQTVENVVLPVGDNWIDGTPADDDESNSRRSSKSASQHSKHHERAAAAVDDFHHDSFRRQSDGGRPAHEQTMSRMV